MERWNYFLYIICKCIANLSHSFPRPQKSSLSYLYPEQQWTLTLDKKQNKAKQMNKQKNKQKLKSQRLQSRFAGTSLKKAPEWGKVGLRREPQGEDIDAAVPPVHSPPPPASCSSVHRLSPESQQLLVLSGIARTALSFMLGRHCKTPNERFTVRACSWILKYPLFSCLSNHEGKPTALMPRIVWMIFSNLQQTPFWMQLVFLFLQLQGYTECLLCFQTMLLENGTSSKMPGGPSQKQKHRIKDPAISSVPWIHFLHSQSDVFASMSLTVTWELKIIKHQI